MRRYLLLIPLLALGGCHTAAEHTGKRPMGRRRAPEYEAGASLDNRMQARESASREANQALEAEAARSRAAVVDAEAQVVGAHGTRVYHNPTCDQLADVARPEQVLFVSPYDALDGGYKPCPRCRPGP